jgi:O-acetylserine/cysteine efflux transporter
MAAMKKSDLALGLLVTIIWGANFSVIKLGLASLDPFLLTSLRFALCALPLIWFVPRPEVPMSVVALYGLLFGVGLWGVSNLGIHLGLSAGLASLILQFSAFFTIIFAARLFDERISRLQMAGMGVASLGLLIVFGATGGDVPLSGAALLVLAALAWSACNLLVRRYRPDDMLAFVVWSSAFAAVPLFAITYAIKGPAPFLALGQALDAKALFSIVFQSYVTTIFGYYVWNSLMKKYPASAVAPLSLVVPVSGLATSALVFGERITPAKLLAALCILAGLALFLLARRLEAALNPRRV